MDDEQQPNELKDIRDFQPQSLRRIIGQSHVTQALEIAVEASFAEEKRVDDILLCGPLGLGKTALVKTLALECAAPFTEVLARASATLLNSTACCFRRRKGFYFLMKFIS